MIEVRRVENRRSRRQFIDLPYRKYRGHPHWIPPARLTEVPQFDPRRNPFFAFADMDLFLAWDGDRLAGRVAAIDDRRHNEVHRDNLAAFGFFEADSGDTARGLLGEVERWAAARGRAAVRGPLNPSLNYSAGFQIDAFDTDPFLMMPWTPPEYPGFVEGAGYRKIKDLYCWLIVPERAPEARLGRLSARVERQHGVAVRRMNLRHIRSEADRLYDVFTNAWKDNWGFVAPTRDEFWHIIKDLRLLRMLDGLLIAEANGRPVGCTIIVPDINQVLKGTNGRLLPAGWIRLLRMRRLVTRARTVLVGVIDEYRETGVLPLLMYTFITTAKRYGFTEAECSWILEDNVGMNRVLEKNTGEMYKTYRLYQKSI